MGREKYLLSQIPLQQGMVPAKGPLSEVCMCVVGVILRNISVCLLKDTGQPAPSLLPSS
jgi:hypothetical protein